MTSVPVLENLDRRILGAFVCVDAMTGLSLATPASASAPQWTLKPNRSGIYVIFDGPGMRALTTQFVPSPSWPAAPTNFEVTLRDPNRRYLPRRVSVAAATKVPVIPAAPAGSATNPAALAALQDSTSVFGPQKISLFPAPSAPVGPNWAVIRASVVRNGVTPQQGLSWAVLQIIRSSDNAVIATGQADASGEALLAVIGLSLKANANGNGPVAISTVDVTIKAIFDPSVLTQPSGWIPNPDDILSNPSNPAFKSTSQPAQLESGQELSMSFAISV